jgi:hypothetical protein
MPVPVMDVRIVRVRMRHRLMLVGMDVRLARVNPWGVLVLMVLVVDMGMCMRQPVVVVLVLVPLAEVQPHPGHHQDSRDGQRRRWSVNRSGNRR